MTLKIAGRLRGCIGTLEAYRPSGPRRRENAYTAAFRDPRFPPLRRAEWASLKIHISILNPPEPLAVSSEAELYAILRPGVDGVMLEEGDHRGTLLPAVWESLPDPKDFMDALKQRRVSLGIIGRKGQRLSVYRNQYTLSRRSWNDE